MLVNVDSSKNVLCLKFSMHSLHLTFKFLTLSCRTWLYCIIRQATVCRSLMLMLHVSVIRSHCTRYICFILLLIGRTCGLSLHSSQPVIILSGRVHFVFVQGCSSHLWCASYSGPSGPAYTCTDRILAGLPQRCWSISIMWAKLNTWYKNINRWRVTF